MAIKGVPVRNIQVDDEIRRALATMTERSSLFQAIKREMEVRGHWKYKNRGSSPPRERQFTRVSIHTEAARKVGEYLDGEFVE